jgi:lipid A 3-O-deacylase
MSSSSLRLFAFLCCAASSPAFAGDQNDLGKMVAPAKLAPWEVLDVTFETGAIWRITNSTPIDYVVLPQMLSFRIPIDWKYDLDSGGTLAIRTRLSLLGEIFAEGPETYFFGFHGSPSFEWWNADQNFAVLYSVGGGVGFLDSTEVEGGHGQDFNFNWFMQLSLRHQLREGLFLQYGAYFQHTSNRGLNDRNPGLNALGPMVGLSWQW